jgi:hypothetical protein
MNDGHTGVSYSQINQGESGNFQLVLSFLKQSTGKGEFVMHVTSNVFYSFGLEPLLFLSQIGLTHYQGQCPFLHDRCFYHVVAKSQSSYPGMEHFSQVQNIHDSFKKFAADLHQLYMLYQQEEAILREIRLNSLRQPLLGEPIQIEIQETDIPLWVNDVKFPQLRELEAQRGVLQKEIDQLNQFLPLLYGTGDSLEEAVLHALRFFGLDAEKTEKGFTADIRAQTPDGTKKFGLEVTGITGHVKKDSPKLTQLMEFERIKEHEEKTVLIANTHNKTPISQRKDLEDFTPQVVTFLERHPILILTGLDLYRMVADVLDGKRTNEELVEKLYTASGRLNYAS